MPMRFTVLASGSAGNASLIEVEGFGLLLDAGLGPRQLANRLAAVGASWSRIHAVLITHTHSDHWHDRTFSHLHRKSIPLYCHEGHHAALRQYGSSFAQLHGAGLVRPYEVGQDVALAPGLRCRALPLRHDGGVTFGFRLEETNDLFAHPTALGYAADLGSWTPDLARQLAEVDVLALEFNHDVQMQYTSGRSFHLIRRVLGDHGHLSNEQAAALVREVLRTSTPGRLRHLVQLHLSRDCNRPDLALRVARTAVSGHEVEVHTASQDTPILTITLGRSPRARRPVRARGSRLRTYRPDAAQPWLPGLEPDEPREASGQ